jgi:hypothetical protein
VHLEHLDRQLRTRRAHLLGGEARVDQHRARRGQHAAVQGTAQRRHQPGRRLVQVHVAAEVLRRVVAVLLAQLAEQQVGAPAAVGDLGHQVGQRDVVQHHQAGLAQQRVVGVDVRRAVSDVVEDGVVAGVERRRVGLAHVHHAVSARQRGLHREPVHEQVDLPVRLEVREQLGAVVGDPGVVGRQRAPPGDARAGLAHA